MMRIGFGTDVHALKEGSGIPLGGVTVPCAFAVEAHSDGDVLLHAAIDALLGACGMGDIGDHFPGSAVARGEKSSVLFARALELAGGAGLRIVNMDCVVDLQAVRLRDWKKAIGANLARLAGLDAGAVNVKAKTAEGFGAVGEGRAVAAQVALLGMID